MSLSPSASGLRWPLLQAGHEPTLMGHTWAPSCHCRRLSPTDFHHLSSLISSLIWLSPPRYDQFTLTGAHVEVIANTVSLLPTFTITVNNAPTMAPCTLMPHARMLRQWRLAPSCGTHGPCRFLVLWWWWYLPPSILSGIYMRL